MTWLVADFETASAIDLKQAGAARYAEDPSTEVICLYYSIKGAPVVPWFPGDPLGELKELAADPAVRWVAHGASFEKAIWRSIMVPEFSLADIKNSRWEDTMATCAHYALPLELEEACQVLNLPVQKDMEGRRITLAFSRPNKHGYYDRTLEKRKRIGEYCGQDVEAEVALLNRIGWLPQSERNIWLLNQRTNERGLRLDLKFVRAAQKIVDDASGPLLKEFSKLTGGLTPGQGKKFLAWLAERDCHIPNLQKETIAETIGSDELTEDDDGYTPQTVAVRLNPDAARGLRIRQLVGSASIKKLKRMDACVSLDGRARGLAQYHGTAPGRAAGRLLQPYNFPRGTLKIKSIGKDGKPVEKAPPPELVVDAIMTGDYEYVEDVLGAGAVEVVASSLRHALVPDPGRVFISGDYAGIQARVVLAIAGQKDKLEIFSDDRTGRKGEDIYLDMASQIYGRPILKTDTAERQTGKNSVLGLGFQMGAKKFHDKYCSDQPIEFAEKVVYTYRKEWAPKVPYCWYGLSDAAVRCVHTGEECEALGIVYKLEDGALSCRLPSGRKIWYQHPRPTRELMPWVDDDGHAVHKSGFRYHVMKQGRWAEVKAFGGLLTENVVMGIEVDIQRRAQLLCEKEGFPVVLEVYDEVVVEPEESRADEKAFRQILLDVEPWVKELEIPIAVETWKGDRYRK